MNKSALITGASNGIGYELANIHAENGHDLILVARNKCKLEVLRGALQTQYGIKVYTIEKDLSMAGAACEVYDEIEVHGLAVDYLINNAGIGDIGLFVNSDWEKQERMIYLNVTTLAHLTSLFLPGMIERGYGV